MAKQCSYAKGGTNFPLLDKTVWDVFEQTVHNHGDRDALVVVHQNIRWNYDEYHIEIIKLAAGLTKLGIKQGDRVGIWAPNCFEWCLTQFATAKIGAIMVCLNPAYRLTEIEFALQKSGCRAIISAESFKSSKYLEMLQTLIPELETHDPFVLNSEKFPNLKSIIRMGSKRTPGMHNFKDVCAIASQEELETLSTPSRKLYPSDPINIQFTSGTTGTPKGATLTHKNIINNGYIIGEGMGLTHHDRLCIPVPLYHCFGMVLGNLAVISHGATAIFPADGFDPLTTLQAVENEKCTALHGVPTMFIAELEHPDFHAFDLRSLRTGIMAGALCPEPIMKRVISEMHMKDILIAYGQTECSPVNHMTHATDPLELRVSTVGRAGPHLEIKIIDAKGDMTKPHIAGEICCKGYAVMQGYWEDEESTASAIDPEGWLHSGDIGVMDTNGYVAITGRIKDMIIRGGENVYPKEIEDFLYSHPKIEDIQVFGIPHDKYGEQVCAWVKLKDGETMKASELKAYCDGQISHFKIPTRIKFVTGFPMTVTGKVQKFKMRVIEIKEDG